MRAAHAAPPADTPSDRHAGVHGEVGYLDGLPDGQDPGRSNHHFPASAGARTPSRIFSICSSRPTDDTNHQVLARGIQLEDAAGVGARQVKRMSRDGIENLPEIQGRADGPAHFAHGAHVLERALERHPPLLELEGALANAILESPVQLLQLGERLGPCRSS